MDSGRRSVIMPNGCQIKELRGQLRPESPFREHDPKSGRDTAAFQISTPEALLTGQVHNYELAFAFQNNGFAAVIPIPMCDRSSLTQ